MNACTTFSPAELEWFGRDFVASWKRHSDVPLFVFYEGQKPDLKGVELIPLDEDKDRKTFIQIFKDFFALEMSGREISPYNYHFDCLRFCHSVPK